MGKEKACHGRGKRNRCKKCCSSFTTLAFSTLGLIIAVATYAMIGAFLFKTIEEGPEQKKLKQVRGNVTYDTQNYTEKIINAINRPPPTTDKPEHTKNRVQRDTDGNSTTDNYNESDKINTSSSFRTTTQTIVMTTTSSNDPVKPPINCTSNENKRLTNMTTPDRNQMTLEDEIRELLEEYRQKIFEHTRNHWDGETNTTQIQGKWTFPAALLYAVTAITTIGYGHVTPATTEGQMVTIFYCLIGLPLTLMCIAKVGHAFATAFRVIYHTCCCAICCLACIMRQHKDKMKTKNSRSDLNDALGALVIGQSERNSSLHRIDEHTPWQEWKQNIETNFNRSLRRDTAVPTYMCLLVMTAYILGGAAMFHSYEKEWNWAQSAYFCFVTLTTIGFGDYVPGFDSKKGRGYVAVEDFVLCALYLLVGLSLIGMCIDLMQVDVGKKIRWASRKIGLTKPKNARTPSDTKKEKVGLKLSCEAIPDTMSNHHMPVSRSVSHSLEVPFPSPVHSLTSKRSSSMPNTPSVPNKFYSPRPSGFSFLPIKTEEEPSTDDVKSNSNLKTKNGIA